MESLNKSNLKYFVGLFLFLFLIYLVVFLPKASFLRLTEEDGLLESIAALLFFITAILFFILFFKKTAFYKTSDQLYYNSYSRRIFFLLLALLFVFLCGEEISWGQRILGFDTPENIKERNMQDEFNLHNLDIFNLRDHNTERKTGIAAYLTAKKIFIYIFVFYLFILPLLNKYSEPVRQLIKRFYLPVPIIELGVLFILNVILFKAFKLIVNREELILDGLAEIEEFNFAVILFLIPFIWYGWPSRSSKTNL